MWLHTSQTQFDPYRHLLRQSIIFGSPGSHILLKWRKTMWNRSSYHFLQFSHLIDHNLCPVQAIFSLIQSRPLPKTFPLFLQINLSHQVITATKIMDACRTVSSYLGITHQGYDFESFHRPRAIITSDHQVPLEHIMAYDFRYSHVMELPSDCLCLLLPLFHICLPHVCLICLLNGLAALKSPYWDSIDF